MTRTATASSAGKSCGQRRSDRETGNVALPPEVEALRPLSAVLGRPTDRAITLNMLAGDPLEALIEYGTTAGRYDEHTQPVSLPAGTPVEVTLDGLKPDTAHFYRLRWRKPGEKDFTAGQEHRFHTQRRPGSTFTFEIQGDSHPERAHQHDPALYAQTLLAAAADCPDFYMTIGDDFSVDYLRSCLSKDATAEHPDGEVAFHYDIPAPGKPAKQGKARKAEDRR